MTTADLRQDLHGSASALDLSVDDADVVASPADPRPGAWTGAPAAVLVDGVYYLAYRLRRPIGEGRGFANVVARSTDGVHFETLAVLDKDDFGGDSLERPAIARADNGWRLYVSVATPGTKHWRVDMVEADRLESLSAASARTVMPGSSRAGVKDPVVVHHAGRWHAWVSCHPLDDPAGTDRMTTEYATSADGEHWDWQGTALAGRPGRWDARGTRVTAALLDEAEPVFYYDGRATAAQNWEEQTGVAVARTGLGQLESVGDQPAGASPYGGGGLRYVSAVRLPDGSYRTYFETTRPDGAHDLRTRLTAATA